jgi:hypothetical protein
VKHLLYLYSHGYGADPYTFFLATLLVLSFGAGFCSVDTTLAKRSIPEKA